MVLPAAVEALSGSRAAVLSCVGCVALLVVSAQGRAQPAGAAEPTAEPAAEAAAEPVAPGQLPVAFGADNVSFDARSRALDAAGRVHVDEPPFHLTSDALRLRRVPIGVLLEGKGKVELCPCLGTPLAVRFDGATVAPPHDLVLRDPVLEVFGVPVAWAPAFWLRSPGRFGLLAPDVQWRGQDGLFLGEGVHVPWRDGDVVRGLDLRAGGYVDGGVAVDAAMRTAQTETHLRWDRLRGDDGLGIAARGATAAPSSADGAPRGTGEPDVAWMVDALRGARAVQATTDVEAAARPFDRAVAQAAWRVDGWTLASGARIVALRGGDLLDLGAGGPVVEARRADAVGHAGAYDATLEAGAVSGEGAGTTTFARAEGGVLLARAVGPLGASVDVRGVGDVADDGTRPGLDAAAQARATLALPLARGFASDDRADPWVHRTEPRLEVAALAERTSGVLVVPAGRGLLLPSGDAFVAAAGWSNSLGRWGSRSAAELDVSGGAVGEPQGQPTVPALRARASATGDWIALRGDLARVFAPGAAGGALVGRARLGPATGLNAAAFLAERDGVDPLVARALVDAPLEPASDFLDATGWTGGARVAVPLGPRITTRAGADVDIDTGELVAALGSLELHDPCDCVVVRVAASHRVGRGGVDVWLTVDLPAVR